MLPHGEPPERDATASSSLPSPEQAEDATKAELPLGPRDTLDFLSDAFNPEEALASESFSPPYPDARVLDNLSKARALLPPELPESLANEQLRPPPTKASQTKHEHYKGKALKTMEEVRQLDGHALLNKVLSCVRDGPLALLHKWREAKSAVVVVTRHACGVRGRATGILEAFDKYCNLVLSSVFEDYTVIVKVERRKPLTVAESLPGSQPGAGKGGGQNYKIRWCRKQERRTRRLNRIFVKGDSVVLLHEAGQGKASAQ